tara:strand:+ start:760 stop:1185 length:426 start_codon:yes stop_codon:yes gene_type:complete
LFQKARQFAPPLLAALYDMKTKTIKPLLRFIAIFAAIVFASWQVFQDSSRGESVSTFLAEADSMLKVDSYLFNENTNTVGLSIKVPEININITDLKVRLRDRVCEAFINDEWQLDSLNIIVNSESRNRLIYSILVLPHECV